MRLQRESRMCKKDLDAQIKKNGKINDNFICLPDPEDPYVWYYLIFGLEDAPYTGGYYFGKITCPPEYPAKAPQINLLTENGRFRLQKDGICLSISSFHPESWNPAWKVNQIVIGLLSFWLTNEYTYGAVETYDYPTDIDIKERSIGFAMKSRKEVLENEKFKLIFGEYADAIGINEEPNVPAWADYVIRDNERKAKAEAEKARLAKIAEERRIAEAKRVAEELEQKRIADELAERKKKQAAIKDYFKLLKEKGLTKYIGQPQHAAKQLRRLQA